MSPHDFFGYVRRMLSAGDPAARAVIEREVRTLPASPQRDLLLQIPRGFVYAPRPTLGERLRRLAARWLR